MTAQRGLGNRAVQGLLSGPAGKAMPGTEAGPGTAETTPTAEYAPEPTAYASLPEAAETPTAERPKGRVEETETGTEGRGEGGAGSYIAEDGGGELQPGQMRRTAFLQGLRASVITAANEQLAGTGRTAHDCPWIELWFDYYRDRAATQVESALRSYVPEAASAGSAEEYIELTAERVRRGVAVWVETGEVTEVPAGIPIAFPMMSMMAAGRAGGGGGSAAPGKVRFKARGPGHPRPPDPQAVRGQLGPGRALELSTRGRMEAVFGADLSRVRLHTDSMAASLAGRHDARAFAVGEHVAFGAGEYRPGTPFGDALLAHELAHVLQQQSSQGNGSPSPAGDLGESSLEREADRSAIIAFAALWTGARGTLGTRARRAGPSLRSGLRLSRCKSEPQKTLKLNISKLEGSSRAIDVTDASTIWENAANIKITTGNTETVNKADSEAMIGTDLILDEFTTPGTPTAEEVALTKRNRAPDVITAYFVKSLSRGSHGEAFRPSLFTTVPPSVAIKDGDAPFVAGKPLAHELGHILLDEGSHPSTTSNLMSYSHTGVGLDSTRRSKARGSSFVT